MIKGLSFWIITTFILSVCLVAGLVILAEDIRNEPGSFLRQYPPHPAVQLQSINLPNEYYYFAGAANGKIYLANTSTPLYLMEMNSDLYDTSVVHLRIDNIEKQKYFRITVTIDSPYYYLMDGAMPYIYRGNIMDWKGELMKASTYFVDAIPISSNTFAIRALSSSSHEHELGKMSMSSGNVRLNYDLLEKQFDGIFDVDGSFTRSRALNRLVYLYYYRNEFIVMDTNLNLVYRGNTIDTFKIAQVKTAKVSSEDVIKLSAPPLTTNQGHAIYRHYLFVHSLLPAKNEYMQYFRNASVIDVYDLNNGSYQFSFYLFEQNGEKVRSIKISDGVLYALFKKSITSYKLSETNFGAPY